ncbi:hypothetical protein FJZ19_01045 [Candidatus Pacearchaeota archaeon]|nr:hypothetical protein [Candidatus Pacearchaeota archaeon]
MIIKFLGILDIITAILFWLSGFFHIIPESIMTIFALYLLAKGIFFVISLDIASFIDILIAILIFLSFIVVFPKAIIFLITFYLIQKGIFSLL